MRRVKFVLCLIAGFASSSTASANTVDTVPVGNAGNGADSFTGVGAVPYAFRIGRTEVTNSQYVAFLNAVASVDDPFGLYDPEPVGGNSPLKGITRSGSAGSYVYSLKPAEGSYVYDNKPIFTSWFDALRFANWMHNGQPTGIQNDSTTENGAYTFAGATTVGARNPGARWFLPSENEWFKAAYHKNDGPTSNYFAYPTGTDVTPNNNPPSADTGNSANYQDHNFNFTLGPGRYKLTDVGAYALSESPYGTLNQGGNLSEWNELVEFDAHGVRGGSFFTNGDGAGQLWKGYPYRSATGFHGFRLAAAVPEPSICVLAALALLGAMFFAERRSAANA